MPAKFSNVSSCQGESRQFDEFAMLISSQTWLPTAALILRTHLRRLDAEAVAGRLGSDLV
jgi:hypothetical protein